MPPIWRLKIKSDHNYSNFYTHKYTKWSLNFLIGIRIGLDFKKMTCKFCKKDMKLRRKKREDGLKWGCRSNKCKDREVYIRKGSKFENLKTSPRNIIKIIYEGSKNTKIKRVKEETHPLQANHLYFQNNSKKIRKIGN